MATLIEQIQASEPAVTLTRIDKPRIDLVLAQAKRRLEAYRKRVSLSGRLARSHRGFDYSYSRSKLHPLGVQMFSHLVYPAAAPNREMHEAPRPRIFQHSPDANADAATRVVEEQTYHLKEGGTSGGPYEWALDLCHVTLASFQYRKMSLVRDYAGMLESEEPDPSAFVLFSVARRFRLARLPTRATSTYLLMMPSPSIDVGHLLNGRYRVDALVHARKGATHFAATDLSRGDRVSVYVHAAGAPGALDWFLGGAEWAKTLRGPHVAKVLEAGVLPSGSPWIVREHVASGSLAVHLARYGALKLGDAVDVALAVCDALAEAHGSAVLHGGLGPHAVHAAWSASGLVDVKVTGIGTALAETALTLGATGSGDGVLRSPEQLRHAPIDARVDVWAVGALLYTLLAGVPPFKSDTPSGASLSVVLDEPAPIANLPTPLADILDRTLAKDPNDRPQSILELAEAISFYATSPEFARERITARRPRNLANVTAQMPVAMPGDATLVDHREPVANAVELPRVMIDAALLETTVKRPAVIPAVVRAIPREVPRRRLSVEETVLVRAVFPRRRALKIMGGITAVVSLLLVILLGTEARLHRAHAAAAAEQAPTVIAASSAMVLCPSTPAR